MWVLSVLYLELLLPSMERTAVYELGWMNTFSA